MTTPDYVIRRIKESFPEARVYVKNPLGDGLHFHALIVSDDFEGVSLVQRQRQIMKALEKEMRGEIHALSLKTLTEQEFSDRKESLQKYLT